MNKVKISAMSLVWITTLLLVTLTVMVTMDLPFNWVFYLSVLGQVFVVLMVYRVLTDDYTTDKTFDDFYEDYDTETKRFR
ncbi:hypothetical protein [Gilvibacter sediminis]|uniref:hypothetical protein n=1 Tax=Gilvibacter sediminis TaxID=379071 RepID=UPI002350A3EE|nr:hypothetical protein [Gilvibacter sediminis]MDC7998748.1 hypothetical protein [Gilvibacter sediminis]